MTDLLHTYYAQRAAEYERVYDKPERQADLAAMRRWLPLHFAGRRVLEVACGTGWWTRVMAPVAAQVTAFDAAPQTLDVARSRAAAPLPDGASAPAALVEFVEGDAYTPPSNGAPWDAAFAGFWWSHVPRARLPAFLDTLHQRLAPGAPVIFLDNRLVPGSSTPVSPPDAAGDTWQERRLDDGSLHRVLKNFPDEAELREAVAAVDPGASVTLWRHYWALVYRLPHPIT